MATIERFEDLKSWQVARELTRGVYRISRRGEFARDQRLKDQMRGAAMSTMSNIAEGFERGGNREFSQSLSISKGECGEVRSLLYVAHDAGYIDQAEFDCMQSSCLEISRLIASLMSYLKTSELRGSKYRVSEDPPDSQNFEP